MGFVASVGSKLLISLNGVVLIAGLGILVAGILVQMDESIVSEHIMPILNGINIESFNLGDLISTLSITCIAVGGFLTALAGLGVFGACCRIKILLILYGAVVLLILVAQVVAVVMWFLMHEQLADWLKTQLTGLLAVYDGDVTDESTMAWNFIFILMECCGVNAVSTTNDFTATPWWSSQHRYAQQIPPTCCVGASSSNMASYVNSTCTTSPTSTNSYWKIGCYDVLYTSLNMYSKIFIIACCVIAVVEVLAIFFTYKVYKSITAGQVHAA
ncbi:hypothetical protein ScPMuIL_003054 [Solemya velum]